MNGKIKIKDLYEVTIKRNRVSGKQSAVQKIDETLISNYNVLDQKFENNTSVI